MSIFDVLVRLISDSNHSYVLRMYVQIRLESCTFVRKYSTRTVRKCPLDGVWELYILGKKS